MSHRVARPGKPESLLEDGKLALGVVLGLFGSILFLLTLAFLDKEPSRSEVTEVAPALVALIVAGVGLVISIYGLREQRRMRQAGTDPVLVAHLLTREDAPIMVNLAITNVGAGAALDVNISAARPAEFPELDLVIDPFRAWHPIAVILQARSIQFPLQIGPELLGDPSMPPFQIKLSYRDIEGREYFSTHTIDARELEWMDAHDPPLARIAKAIEAIANK